MNHHNVRYVTRSRFETKHLVIATLFNLVVSKRDRSERRVDARKVSLTCAVIVFTIGPIVYPRYSIVGIRLTRYISRMMDCSFNIIAKFHNHYDPLLMRHHWGISVHMVYIYRTIVILPLFDYDTNRACILSHWCEGYSRNHDDFDVIRVTFDHPTRIPNDTWFTRVNSHLLVERNQLTIGIDSRSYRLLLIQMFLNTHHFIYVHLPLF